MCPNDIEEMRWCVQTIFLAGLDHSLDEVSGQVMAAFSLPSLEEAYQQVCREE